MKAKNILMSVLLAMGFIAAKAATGYPAELALVSQPVLVYNYNSITVYYDVQNIGDYTYRGDIYLYLDPDNGYYYGSKYVRVCPGRIKRVSIEIPAYRPNPGRVYTIMPYYEMGNELYSFTTFEYFEPLNFYWNGPRTERWVVINVPPRVRYYTRPGHYRYYYDGFRPPMPPPHMAGHGHGPHTPPPLNPMHHTYGYHSNNGGYPATHNLNNEPPTPNNGNTPAPTATVRPNNNAGSMSNGNTTPSNNNVGSSSNTRPNSSGNVSNGSSSNRPNSSGSVSRPGNNNSSSSSGSVSNGSNNRPNNSSNVSRPNNGNSNNNSGNVSRPSSNTRPSNNTGNSSSSGRVNNSNSNTRPSSGSSSSGRSGNSSTRNSNSSSNRSGSSSTRGSR